MSGNRAGTRKLKQLTSNLKEEKTVKFTNMHNRGQKNTKAENYTKPKDNVSVRSSIAE